MRPEQKRPSEIDRRQNHNPFEIDMSAERNERSYRGESGYSILDAVNINDGAYRVGGEGNGRSNDGDDDGNNPGYPREPMNDQTTRNPLPPPQPSRMRKVLGIGGLLVTLYFGGLTNAHKAIGSGCSYAYQGTKSIVADPFTTTPEELVEEVQSTFQRYQKEIESGSYAKEQEQLASILDQHATPKAKLERLQRHYAGRSVEATMNRLSKPNEDHQQKLDYLAADTIEVLYGYLPLEQKKKFAQQALGNIASAFTAQETRKIMYELGQGSPEFLTKVGIEAIILAKRNYAAISELAKDLTPPQRQALYTQLAPASAPAPALPAKPTLPPPKPAAPAVKPAASTLPTTKLNADSYEKVQQRARVINNQGG